MHDHEHLLASVLDVRFAYPEAPQRAPYERRVLAKYLGYGHSHEWTGLSLIMGRRGRDPHRADLSPVRARPRTPTARLPPGRRARRRGARTGSSRAGALR